MPEQKNDISISNLLHAQRELLMGPGQPVPAQPAVPATQTAEKPDDDAFVNIRHYAFLVYGRKWWVLLVTILVVGAACLYGYQKKEVYVATCHVRLEDNLGNVVILGGRQVYHDPESLALLADGDSASREANLQLIAVLESVKDDPRLKLKGDDLAEIDSAIKAARKREETARTSEGRFDPIGSVRLGKHGVTVSASHEAAESRIAAKIITRSKAKAKAQAIAKLFLEKVSGGQRVEQLESMLKVNDAELTKIAAELDSVKPGIAFTSALRNQVDRLNTAKNAVASTAIRMTMTIRRIESLEKSQKDPVTTLTRSSNPELQTRLLRLRTELAQMRAKYQPDHPRLKAKLLEIAALEDHMKAQPSFEETVVDRGQARLIAEITNAKAGLEALKARQEALKEQIVETEKALSQRGLSREDIEYASNLRRKRALEQTSIDIQRRLREAKLTDGARKAKTTKGNNGIVSVKHPSAATMIGAGLTQTIGFAAILGLVMGVLLALLLEHLDDTVRSELSARRVTNLPVIAKLPRFEGSDQKRFISPAAPRSDVAETFKFFHNHVRYAGPNAPEKCLQITSPGPEEGKSYVAVNLALSFASEGNRVCFVDADLRRSRTHERLDVLRPTVRSDQGLCGYLDGALSFEEAAIESEIENLTLILAGGRATNPPRLLRSDRMQELLERLKAEYDVVIIDAPPVLPVVDSAIISSLARATLLVVRYATTHQGDLAESAGRLAHVNAPLVGVVINGVHGAAAGYYYGRYRYRYRYGSSYGYGY